MQETFYHNSITQSDKVRNVIVFSEEAQNIRNPFHCFVKLNCRQDTNPKRGCLCRWWLHFSVFILLY